jgi:hypothetical protein
MFSFLKNLVRGLQTAKTARPARRVLPRAYLQLESLEDRIVPTSVAPAAPGSPILLVDCTPNRVITFQQASPTEMLISDNVQGLVAQVNRAAFTTIDIAVQGQDIVDIDDSNGMPFLRGQTINLEGGGTNNVVDLFGSRSIDTPATYSAGATASTASTLTEDNLTFHMDGPITRVIDTLQDTGGPLTVSTSGNGVILTSSGGEQTLSNLGPSGGSTFTFANKSQVVLNENAAFTQVFLEARAAALGEQSFTLQMNAQDDSASVLGTPASFITNVQAAGNDQIVNVESTSGTLNIGGGDTTDVNMVAVGIQASVKINDVADLVVTNTGSAAQNVTVTQDTIFGTGLFGNNSAEVVYQHVKLLAINAGSGADQYTVDALSGPFTTKLEIEDTSSTTSFVDDVFVNSLSELNMDVINLANPEVGELIVNHDGGTASISKVSPTSTNGVVKVSFPGELPSEVTFDGFEVVKTEKF